MISLAMLQMISPVFKGPMSQPGYAQTYTQAGAIAGATAAMQARAAQIQVCSFPHFQGAGGC